MRHDIALPQVASKNKPRAELRFPEDTRFDR